MSSRTLHSNYWEVGDEDTSDDLPSSSDEEKDEASELMAALKPSSNDMALKPSSNNMALKPSSNHMALPSSNHPSFEQEMELELASFISSHETNSSSQHALGGADVMVPATHRLANQASSSDTCQTSKSRLDQVLDSHLKASHRQQSKKKPISADLELFYDPDLDEENERWVENMRARSAGRGFTERSSLRRQSTEAADFAGRASNNDMDPQGQGDEEDLLDHRQSDSHPKAYGKSQRPKATNKKLPQSDAVLNCPACMVTLCLDCQRHAIYKSQYRAMFVMNCRPGKDALVCPLTTSTKKTKKQKRRSATASTEVLSGTPLGGSLGTPMGGSLGDDKFYPVTCDQCTTQVAVMDTEEVFHFFNVLASHQ